MMVTTDLKEYVQMGVCMTSIVVPVLCFLIFEAIRFNFYPPSLGEGGILVAPGFCTAAGVRCHVFLWAQKLKHYWSIFFEILTWHS